MASERLGTVFDELGETVSDDDAGLLGFFPSYTWQLVFLPMFAALGAFLLWFLSRELRSYGDKMMVVSAIGLFVFAVALDFLEGIEPVVEPGGKPFESHGNFRKSASELICGSRS